MKTMNIYLQKNAEEKLLKDWIGQLQSKLKKIVKSENHKLEYINKEFTKEVESLYTKIMLRYYYFKGYFKKELEIDYEKLQEIKFSNSLKIGFENLKDAYKELDIAMLNELLKRDLSPQDRETVEVKRKELIDKHVERAFRKYEISKEKKKALEKYQESFALLNNHIYKAPDYKSEFSRFKFFQNILRYFVPIFFGLLAAFSTSYFRSFVNFFQEFMAGETSLFVTVIVVFFVTGYSVKYAAEKISERLNLQFLEKYLRRIESENKKFEDFVLNLTSLQNDYRNYMNPLKIDEIK